MKTNRRLALRRDALTDLTADELARAVAGDAPPTHQQDCLRDLTLRLTLHKDCSWSCIL